MRPRLAVPRLLAQRYLTASQLVATAPKPVSASPSTAATSDADSSAPEPAPFSETALGTPDEFPPGVPSPLHLDQLSPKRLKFLERTINKERMTAEDEAELQAAMARTRLQPRKRIEFSSGNSGPTRERLAWFDDVDEVGGALEAVEDVAGIETGRVIELRRNTQAVMGLILGTVLLAGRKRLLVLQASGEIWPVVENDVAFTMPASLVPASLAERCWSTDLLQLWARGRDIGISESGAEEGIIGPEAAADMFAARRKVATLLRRVSRETERMASRLTAGSLAHGRGGGIEAVWEHFVPEDPESRSGVHAAEVAQFLLNAPGTPEDKRVVVRPNTLPAFAAHTLLMRRPDLFVADERNMWASGFMVRSRGDRSRLERVRAAVDSDGAMLTNFVAKAAAVRKALTDGQAAPEWSADDLDIIWILALTIVETRSTQAFVANPLAAMVVKAFGIEVGKASHAADVTAPLLSAIGMLSAGDSARTSLLAEQAKRNMAIANVVPAAPTADITKPTAADIALDPLRVDFPHRVFVIDDADAKELDDGVALERTADGDYWIHVHIADPTRFLAYDDVRATAAAFVGASSYFPEGTTPLLPKEMGAGQMSLGESGASQSVMVFSARVDMAGNIRDYKVQLGHLPSAVLTTYADVNAALGMQSPLRERPLGSVPRTPSQRRTHAQLTPEDISTLGTLRDLANALRAKRYESSGLEWQLPVGLTTPTGVPPPLANLFDRTSYSSSPAPLSTPLFDFVVEHRAPTVSAENTVAEMMILANSIVARFCADRGIPVPFRGSLPFKETSATPAHLSIERLLASREKGSGNVDHYDIIAANITAPESAVSSIPIPHWIMGLDRPGDAYVRATSPLRRFDDMLVHWQLKGALGADAGIPGARQPFSADDVLKLADRADAAGNRIKIAQRSAIRYWMAGFLHDRMAGPLPAGVVPSAPGKMADLADLDAHVYGPLATNQSQARLPVFVPQLGLVASVQFPAAMFREADLVVGAKIKATIDLPHTTQWPNAIINLKPTSTEVVPPAAK